MIILIFIINIKEILILRLMHMLSILTKCLKIVSSVSIANVLVNTYLDFSLLSIFLLF